MEEPTGGAAPADGPGLAGRGWGRHGIGASFRFAFRGLAFALRTQRNLRIHFAAASVAILCCAALPVSALEMALVAVAVASVMITELFNTAIEAAVDLGTRKFHPLAGLAKDTAAAAVLVSSGFAVVVGGLVFYDKLFPLRLREGAWVVVAFSLPVSLLCAGAALFPRFFSGGGRTKRGSRHPTSTPS